MTIIYRFSVVWTALALIAFLLLKWTVLLLPVSFFFLMMMLWIVSVIYTMHISMLVLAEVEHYFFGGALTFNELLHKCQKRMRIPLMFPEETLTTAIKWLCKICWIKPVESDPLRYEVYWRNRPRRWN